VPPPAPPKNVSGLPEEEQARILLRENNELYRYGGEASRMLRSLQQWVNDLYAEERRNAD